SKAEAHTTQWDLLCAFDVLEHFEEIDELWRHSFTWGYFSLPAPPSTGVSESWRHFKPHEHLWYITQRQFMEWTTAHEYEVVASGTPEDCIRTRWDPDEANINTFLIR